MFPPAPRNTFARRRIGRYLRHTYTRVPVLDILDSGQALDAYGVDQYNQPEMVYGDPIPNQPCLYQDTRMVMQRTDHGTEVVSTPTLVIAWDDPLKVGDQVLEVRDTDGTLYELSAVAELPSQIAPGGEQVYQTFSLRSTYTPNEPAA